MVLNQSCQCAAFRLAAIHPSHPLHRAVAKCAIGRKKYPPPLQNILRFAGVNPSDFEQRPLSRRPLPSMLPEPRPDRAAATRSAWADTAHLQVFTDATASRLGAAAAAVLWESGGRELRTGLRLGDTGSLSILDAEIAGILLAAHLVVLVQEDTIVDDVSIYSDSQAAISCINNHSQGASTQLLKATCRAIRLAKKGSGGTTVHLRWCPGHAGIPGNEEADKEAARVAGGLIYPPLLIPQFLTEYRPTTNPTTCKKAMQAANRTLAEAHWVASDAFAKFTAKYPNISPRHFLAHSHSLSRSKATLLFRLTTGHIQLRQHLFRLQLVDSPKCEHCGVESETVSHFLFRCPHFAAQRWEHIASRGNEFLKPAFLLLASDALEPLFDYVKATGRFADLVR
ncbi:hypothetical protein ACGC1H_006829 [Rhizoctonia solani]